MIKFWNTIRSRWTTAMPKFFSVICWVGALISGTALAANTAITAGGGTPHEWWTDIYPYLLGIPAGAAFVAKFTRTYNENGDVNGNENGNVNGNDKWL
jgi:hypothetical protein